MGSIFIRYGLKSGGGAPFLRRTRNAFGQLQSRTRTGATTNQLQTRIRSCSCTTSPGYLRGVDGGVYNNVCFDFVCAERYGFCNGSCSPEGETRQGCSYASSANCPYESSGTGMPHRIQCTCARVGAGTTCSLGGYSGWYNTSSCSAFTNSCYSTSHVGVRVRRCQTISVCNFGAFTSFSNVASCTPANPTCSNGAVNRECQTVFIFREEDGSPFEEADECIPSSPIAANGAVAVECIAN